MLLYAILYDDYEMTECTLSALLRTYCSYTRYINLMRMPSHYESLGSAIVMTFNQYTLFISFESAF